MRPTTVKDLPALLGGDGVAGQDRPLLTYCDDATGERTELTAAALGGWAARTAGLLREDRGLDTGSRAAVLLPPHWQTAAVLLGAWSIGMAEASRHSASLPAYGSVRPTDAASPDGTTYRAWGGLAREMADRLDLRAGDRLLVDVAKHEQPVFWLLAPLAAGASVVLCANLDPGTIDARIAAEGITRVL